MMSPLAVEGKPLEVSVGVKEVVASAMGVILSCSPPEPTVFQG